MQSNQRKKILFFITKSNWGGAQRYVFDLATKLPGADFDTVVVAGGEGILIDMLQKEGIKVYAIQKLQKNISFFREISTAITFFNIIRKERPDVLHVNSSKAGGLGALIGRICRVPKIIFTAHGWAFNEDISTWKKLIFKTLHWMTIQLSHRTISVSNGMRAQMDWWGVQKKMLVVNPGRTIVGMRGKDDARGVLEMKIVETDARLIDYHADFWIGTIAELHPIKRLNRAIDAVSALTNDFPTLRLIIIGEGQLREKLQQQVRDLGLEKHVFFTGAVEEAARFLPAFDLFVLPSKSEAFGYVLIEAGQAHIPAVATDVGGIPDIITNEENGLLVPVDDTPALAKAIRTLLANDELRSDFAHALYQKANEFTEEKMIQETIAVYHN